MGIDTYLNRCGVDEQFKLDAQKQLDGFRAAPLACVRTQLAAEEEARRLAVFGPDVPWADGWSTPVSAIKSLFTPAIAAMRWAVWERTGEAETYLRQFELFG